MITPVIQVGAEDGMYQDFIQQLSRTICIIRFVFLGKGYSIMFFIIQTNFFLHKLSHVFDGVIFIISDKCVVLILYI